MDADTIILVQAHTEAQFIYWLKHNIRYVKEEHQVQGLNNIEHVQLDGWMGNRNSTRPRELSDLIQYKMAKEKGFK